MSSLWQLEIPQRAKLPQADLELKNAGRGYPSTSRHAVQLIEFIYQAATGTGAVILRGARLWRRMVLASDDPPEVTQRKPDSIRRDLILAYDRAVEERDGYTVASWKHNEKVRFLQRLQAEDKSRLVDIGSGPGTHAAYFHEQGIDVTCIDLSPGNVARCKEKGLEAFVCDVMDLQSLGKAFDSAFAMNSLLHVPRRELPAALVGIHQTLTPGGLFFWGQYGGEESEGVYQEDSYEPKRFFSLLEDKQIIAEASAVFKLERFVSVELEDEGTLHFQSLLLRVEN